jgi:hypothetical protein
MMHGRKNIKVNTPVTKLCIVLSNYNSTKKNKIFLNCVFLHPSRAPFKFSLFLTTALFWVITQRLLVISYRRFGTTSRSHPQGSTIQKEACIPNKEFIQGRMWAVKSLSSVVSTRSVVASG